MNEQNINMDSTQNTDNLAGFFGKVYGFLGLGLGVSALTSFLLLSVYAQAFNNFMLTYPYSYTILIFAEFGLVLALSAKGYKNATFSTVGFLAYSLLNGITLGVILAMYDIGTITAAFVTTGVTFGAMAVIGSVTKRDLSGMGHAMLSALIGVIIATLLNIFLLHSSMVDYFISILLVVIFSGLTAYDHQKIKSIYQQVGTNGSSTTGIAVYCALTLYLDFINLFLAFLRIFGKKN